MEDNTNNELIWLSTWFTNQCNGDWERENQIRIYTVDNPGWVIYIDLSNTLLEDVEVEYELHEKNENDWYGFSVKKGIFKGVGDLKKLTILINRFKEIVQLN